ncbi:MAG: GntR family transcriptional regulator [Sulfobacillus thermosulfidooxidans]|uniref:GntR family transcriptional regulator n=1 Tax=Sulfobacillus thermosulfidooxidans TaxID=28034 RepID=A0A2T2X3U4_SULTH|nr:MAG: GntR family transcriptional regulator [Sulfobacillus thermosulfidooxidans]
MGLIDNPNTIAARYRDAILTKRLPAGMSIDITQEARDQGLNPSLLRQAMQILTTMGLVEWEGKSQVKIKSLTTQTLQDLGYTLTRRRL